MFQDYSRLVAIEGRFSGAFEAKMTAKSGRKSTKQQSHAIRLDWWPDEQNERHTEHDYYERERQP